MKITNIEIFRVSGHRDTPNHAQGDRQAQPLDIYPEFNAQDWAKNRPDGRQPISAQYVAIQSDEGISGIFGPIEDEQSYVITRFLRPFLLGRDPLATEILSDQMMRLHRHGRTGLFMTGISAIDCALWDLKGKVYEQPVYRLLGGPTRSCVPAYASMLGYSVEPNKAAKVAKSIQAQEFPAQKWFFRYGPGNGEVGIEKNLALVRSLREALGPHYPLMMDAFNGWDLSYGREMLTALEPYHLTWVEEVLPPERLSAYASLRSAVRVPLATGEHVYTRWQVQELLAARAVDFIQTDPDWCGGISELVKICALASGYGVPVVAHGHSLLAALHVAGSQSPTVVPYVEYLLQHQQQKQYFHKTIYIPEKGQVQLPALSGLGLVLDESMIEKWEAIN